MRPIRPAAQRSAALVALVAAVGAAAGLSIWQSWVADDAFITLRTVEAALRGDGLVWNPGQRVQAYTHPLWMGVLLAVRAVAGRAYEAALVAGWVFSAIAIALLVRLSRGPWRAAFVVFAFAMSKPLVHYATSGLENPLSHVLVLAAVWVTTRGRPTVASLQRFGWIAGLAFLTRPDLVVPLAPAGLYLLARLRREGVRALVVALLPGATVVLAWEAFSLLYYGALVPNTAVAKLTGGLPIDERVAQGVDYLVATARWDPWTALVIAGGIAVGALGRPPSLRVWAAGAAAYVLYVVWIGGDFMAGRFTTTPAVLALVIVARSRFPARRGALVAVPAAALALASALVTRSPWHHPTRPGQAFTELGVADEQAFWFADTALFWPSDARRSEPPPRHARYAFGRRMAAGEVEVYGMVGFLGYGAADRGIVVDPMGLADPLLARLPPVRDQSWRPGHLVRQVPPGYVETVRDGRCRMRDAELCTLWSHLERITAGPLWSAARLESIWALNRGALDALVDVERYRRPSLVRRTPAQLEAEPARFRDSGLSVQLEPRPGPVCVRVRLEGGARYRLALLDGDEARCDAEHDLRDRSLRLHEVRVGCGAPVDRLLVEPLDRPRRRRDHGASSVSVEPTRCR